MILVVGGIKGGSGKTTLATNLAVIRAKKKKILLVDADDQKSTWDWSEQRASHVIPKNYDPKSSLPLFPTVCLSGKSIYNQIRQMEKDYEDIIIDTGGRDTASQRSALTCANVYLIPFKPRSLDIWTLGSVKSLLNEIHAINKNLKSYVVINQADPSGKDNENALSVLSECPELKCFDTWIGNRKIFSNAATDGLGVTEYLGCSDQKASQEIMKLYEYIYNI